MKDCDAEYGDVWRSGNYPDRKSPRARWMDYDGGLFFITVCTRDKEHMLGYISKGLMFLSDAGKHLKDELENVNAYHPRIEIPKYVIMPNHFHVILCVKTLDDEKLYCDDKRLIRSGLKRSPVAIAIGGIKAGVTRRARMNGADFGWQSRYHDRAIRNESECRRIIEYIENNVGAWDSDCFNV